MVMLILNADDWGRTKETTDRIRECVLCGTVSSVSAMVFMQDSERAATIATAQGIDAGLHLNFTTAFSGRYCPARLTEHQKRVARWLGYHRFAKTIFHPGLIRSFEYVVAAQLDEFHRLYGGEPRRLDGHHHMHLCTNVLFTELLPAGTIVRRNFSFEPREKSFVNRFYRCLSDRILARHHRLSDFFFSLRPLDVPNRLARIFSLARCFVVEVETHPVTAAEFRFLSGGEILRRLGNQRIATGFIVEANGNG